MIRILLVDDQFLLCEVLKTWLEVEDDFQVIGVAHDGQEGLEKVEALQPDIVLMDIDMPGMDGLSATKHICEKFPQVKVIFLSGHDDDNYLGKSLRAGARGYLLKNTTAEELAAKIRLVHNSNNTNNILPAGDRDDLVVIQNQVEELMESYRYQFQQQLEAYKDSLTQISHSSGLDMSYEKRLNELEHLLRETKDREISQIKQENLATRESIRAEIINIHNQLSEANHSLSSQVNQQIVNLKHDLDSQLKNALDDWSRQRATLQEWAVQRDEMQISPEELDSRYRQELVSWANPIRTSLRNADKQIKILRSWLIATAAIAFISLNFSAGMLIFNFMSGNSQSSQIEK
ncbi:MAG: response regulator [Xenococcaceae cyanobacterium MO_188.B19]|nr:response regulator [Xenococcaceae cyanobacterium MO_188.B19]